MALKIIRNNIIEEPADIVVTPASRKPRVGVGLDKVIHKAAGAELLKARAAFGTIEPGVVQCSPSFGLARTKCHARHVIHALGPYCEREKLNGTERPILIGCYLQILCLAVSLKAKTISIPVMSSGKFGMPMPMAVDIAVEAIELFLKAVPDLNVKLVGIDEDFFDYVSKRYPRITESKLDAKWVEAYRKTNRRERTILEEMQDKDGIAEEEKSLYFKNVRYHLEIEGKPFKQLFCNLWEAVQDRDKREAATRRGALAKMRGRVFLTSQAALSTVSKVSARKIRRYLATTDKTIPPRNTLIALALAMGAPHRYLLALLASCGYPTEGGNLEAYDRLILREHKQGKTLAEIVEMLRHEDFDGADLSPLV